MDVLLRAMVRAQARAEALGEDLRERGERGDVPGWVLITIMTAGLVTVLWAAAKTQLVRMFNDALDGVKG